MTSEWLFRIGFVSFLLAALFFLLAAWALYVLLKPVNKDLAFLFVLLNLGGVVVQCISLSSEFGAQLLLSPSRSATSHRNAISDGVQKWVYDRPILFGLVGPAPWLSGH